MPKILKVICGPPLWPVSTLTSTGMCSFPSDLWWKAITEPLVLSSDVSDPLGLLQHENNSSLLPHNMLCGLGRGSFSMRHWGKKTLLLLNPPNSSKRWICILLPTPLHPTPPDQWPRVQPSKERLGGRPLHLLAVCDFSSHLSSMAHIPISSQGSLSFREREVGNGGEMNLWLITFCSPEVIFSFYNARLFAFKIPQTRLGFLDSDL